MADQAQPNLNLTDNNAYVRMSDGSVRHLKAGMTHNEVTKYVDDEEKALVGKYTATAKKQGYPVETPYTIYSQSRAYPNNLQGKIASRADHWLYPGAGSNLGMAERIAVPAAVYGGSTAALGGVPAAPLIDLGATAINAVRHGLGYTDPAYDVPTILGTAENALNVPQPGPEEGPWTKRIENLAAQLASGPGWTRSPGQFLRSAAGTEVALGGSELLGNVGGSVAEGVAGPNWREAGELAGSTLTPQLMTSPLNPRVVAARNSPEIAQSAENINVTPAFSTLAGPTGMRFSKALASLPFVGLHTANANNRVVDQLLEARNRAAEEIAGHPITPQPGHTGTDRNFIGQNLIEGARTAARTIRQNLNSEQDAFAQQMGNTGVSIAPILRDMHAYINDPRNGVTPEIRQALTEHLRSLVDMTQGGPGYQRGWNMQSGDTVPWAALRNWRSQVLQVLRRPAPGQASPTEHTLSALDDSVTNTMQQSADLVSPGLGNAFRTMNSNYAFQKNYVLPELERVGGVAITDPHTGATNYAGGLQPGQAAMEFYSPTKKQGGGQGSFIDIASSNPAFPRQNWSSAAGGFVSTLGEQDGVFRPEWAARDWNNLSDDMKNAIAAGPGGQPLRSRQDLEDIATVAANTAVPVARHGLTEQAGAFGGLMALTEMASKYLTEHAHIPEIAAGAATPVALSYALDNPWFRAAMSQRGGTGFGGPLTQAATTSDVRHLDKGAANYWSNEQGPTPYYSPYAPSFGGPGVQPKVPLPEGPPPSQAAPTTQDVTNSVYQPSFAAPAPPAPTPTPAPPPPLIDPTRPLFPGY